MLPLMIPFNRVRSSVMWRIVVCAQLQGKIGAMMGVLLGMEQAGFEMGFSSPNQRVRSDAYWIKAEGVQLAIIPRPRGQDLLPHDIASLPNPQ